MSETTELFDVIATNIETGAQRFIGQAKSEQDAEAIVTMAVMRRGLDKECFWAVPHPHVLRARRKVS